MCYGRRTWRFDEEKETEGKDQPVNFERHILSMSMVQTIAWYYNDKTKRYIASANANTV